MKDRIWSLGGIAAFLVLWEWGSRITGSALILPGPLPVARQFLRLLGDPRFREALVGSFLRVLAGIALAAPLGIAAGMGAGFNRRINALIRPLVSVISAAPVMSVILILFLWFGAERTPVAAAFLMIFPVMTATTMTGIRSTDPRLEELLRLYALPFQDRLFSFSLPSLAPFILGGLRSSVALCWKVVAAAEVLVQPLRALGTGMQRAKAQLETAELFAWTLAAILAAALTQGALSLLFRRHWKAGP